MGRGKRQWPVISKDGGRGRSSSQWGREEGWKIGCWVSLRFRLFGRHEISIFLVLRTIPDRFPLNPTYGLNRDREKISMALA